MLSPPFPIPAKAPGDARFLLQIPLYPQDFSRKMEYRFPLVRSTGAPKRKGVPPPGPSQPGDGGERLRP